MTHLPDALTAREGSLADLDIVRQKLLRDFPPDEVKSLERLRQLIASRLYRLYWFSDPTRDGDVGYAIVYQPQQPRMRWLDYFAIEPGLRDQGYGSRAFRALCGLSADTQGLMLEVQPPTSDDPATLIEQQRRIAFYTRLGARRLDVPYFFPSASRADPLLLYFWPTPTTTSLSRETIQGMVRRVYEDIHGDVPNRGAILDTFIDAIDDQSL